LRNNLTIWQQNVNKSPSCQHDLLSSNVLSQRNIDVVVLQEPSINAYNYTVASWDWTSVYPSMHAGVPDKTRAVTLISSQICSDNWNQLDFPSRDVIVTHCKGNWGELVVFNIYNNSNSNETINLLTQFHRNNSQLLDAGEAQNTHILWLGDFNRHHPHWDDPSDMRLFTRAALDMAEVLIEAVAEAGLDLVLPSGIPTHVHNVTKHWSRLDQVFISEHSLELVITCDTQSNQRGLNTDHLPILTELKPLHRQKSH